ncbi:uncharacterized protein [Centruroides vittatus]|uniref:uncharacterized protein isoform X2 n=1 Tax=Centruroides vittatus TaxID=120091 RepID=UPI00350FDC43
MGSEQFYVKWNNHQPNMIAVFDQLLTNETFVDVTLACEGVRLKAHKIILSACSSFFQNLFLENPCKHPIVIMKDVKYTELKTVLDFVYKGEIKVTRDQLTGLIKLAKLLNIKGLEEVKDDEQPILNNDAQTTAPNSVSSQQQLVYTFQYVPSPFIPIQPRYNMILPAVEKNEKNNKEKSSSDTNSHNNLECHNSKIKDSGNEKSTKESSEMNTDSHRNILVTDANSQIHDDDSSTPSITYPDVCIKEEKASDDDSNYNEYTNFTDQISKDPNNTGLIEKNSQDEVQSSLNQLQTNISDKQAMSTISSVNNAAADTCLVLSNKAKPNYLKESIPDAKRDLVCYESISSATCTSSEEMCVDNSRAISLSNSNNYHLNKRIFELTDKETPFEIKSGLTYHESRGSSNTSHEENSEYLDNSTDHFILPGPSNYLLNKQFELGDQDDLSDYLFIIKLRIFTMGSEQFYVKWNNHQPNMFAVFDQLLTNETFVDVTLACEGVRLKAHKIILSACSSFFQNLFLENPCKHPIVIMKDVKYTELKTVLDFVYKGEIKVTRDQLSGLIKLAKLLNIKGLEEVKDDEQPISNNDAQTTTPNSVSSQQQLVYTFQYVPSPFIPIQPRYNMILSAVEKNKKSNKEKSSSDTNSHNNLECHNSKINDLGNERTTKESSEINTDSHRNIVVTDDVSNGQIHDDSSTPSIIHPDVCIKEEKALDDDSNYNEYTNFTNKISEETNISNQY